VSAISDRAPGPPLAVADAFPAGILKPRSVFILRYRTVIRATPANNHR
jgi:hypothetical protein